MQCTAVKRWLKKRGVEFVEASLIDNPEQLEEFKADGLMQAPVIEVEGFEPFGGFDTDKLEERFGK